MSRCLLACGETAPFVVGFDRTVAREGSFPYARCPACGLVQAETRPSAAEIAEAYPAEYGPHATLPRARDRKAINRLAIRNYYSRASLARPRWVRLAWKMLGNRVLRDVEPPRGDCRLLDWGAAGGSTLALYRDLGWSVAGIEPDGRAAARARALGLEVFESTLEDAPLGERRFDLVLGSHVIEHVLDPRRDLGRARELLAPAGRIVLVTPNAASPLLSWFGSAWFALDAPRHLQIFTPRAIRLLASQAGLEVVSLTTRVDPSIAAASRRLRRVQGDRLPEDLGERSRRIAAARSAAPTPRLALRALGLLFAPLALAGRGDEIRAELAPQGPDYSSTSSPTQK